MIAHNAPELGNESEYATCSLEMTIGVPADKFLAWYMRQPIEQFMHGSVMVPPITSTEPLPGPQWGEVGAARQIFFKDGTIAFERILETDFPRSYRYQPDAYDNPVRLLSDHAVSHFQALPDPQGTKVVWDYGIHARRKMFLPPLQLFVSFDWKKNLSNGLQNLKAHLETHGTALDMGVAEAA